MSKSKATVYQAPNYPPSDNHFSIFPQLQNKSIFLAGSIEMGKAEDWQKRVIEEFKDTEYLRVFNPRRDDWNSAWDQDIENGNFYEQVNWEMDQLDTATVIAMYFDPATYSPISLLELGLYASSGKLVVCCPEGFWRKGNVDILCARYGIPNFKTMDSWLVAIKNKLR